MADMKSKPDFLKKAISAESAEEVQDLYTKWADTYDKDMRSDVTYNGPRNGAVELASRLGSRTEAHILDLGAGTGLVATELSKLGFSVVDALDASEAMLEEARRKGLYQRYIHGFLGQPLAVHNDAYDALICIGTFLPQYADETCLEELLRIVKPGGYVVFTIANYPELIRRIEERISELQSADLWILLNPGAVSHRHLVQGDDVTHEDARIYTIQKHS